MGVLVQTDCVLAVHDALSLNYKVCNMEKLMQLINDSENAQIATDLFFIVCMLYVFGAESM